MAGTRKKPLIDEVSRRFLPTYRPEFCATLREVFSGGESIAAFCATVGIGRACFYEWIDNHPEFKAAYAVALECGRAKMLKLGLQGMVSGGEFNFQVWNTLSKRQYAETDTRAVRIPELIDAQTPSERQEIIIQYLAEARLTPQEAREIAQVWLAGISIEEHTKLLDRIKALEDIKGISDADIYLAEARTED